jgi:hypothetical protein
LIGLAKSPGRKAASWSGPTRNDLRHTPRLRQLVAALHLGLEPAAKVTLPVGLPSCYTKSMKKVTRVKQKVIGRPRTGITPLMGFRADPVIRAAIVQWAEKQPDMPTLSEAIRRLVEIGLKAKGK